MRLNRLFRLVPRLFGKSGYLNRQGVIFIVGHMRAYTTLLAHLVGSHPQVAGYAEMHQKYRGILDLLELAQKIENLGANPPAGRYLLDKILHPTEIRPRILRRRELAVLVVVRPPAAALPSILKEQHGGITTLKAASDYYLKMLQRLRSIIELRAGKVLFIDADAIVQDTERTLAAVSDYLRLSPQLTPHYRLFKKTGQAKFGDTSERIRSGRVEAAKDGETVAPPLPLSREVQLGYEEFRSFAMRASERSVCYGVPI